jgi:hypothetical protein
MVVEIQVNQWLTNNKLVFFIRVNPWIDTQNNISSQRWEKNIGHCVMNTQMSFFWKR